MSAITPPSVLTGGKAVLLTGMFGAPEKELRLPCRMAIADVIRIHKLAFRLPTIAVLNGEPVLRKDWATRHVEEADVIAFVTVPGGGGGNGGNGGKQIIGLIAALALSVAAPFVGSFIAGGLGFAAGTMGFGIASSLASAAFLAGGALLLNALMPPPEPQVSSLAAAERVYSARATSNQATPLEELPVLYGRLRFAPRHASRPYSEYRGNDQFLYQLFLITAGKADVSKIEIGETEAWSVSGGYSSSFSDLEFQIIQPGQSVTLFPANVITSSEVAGQAVPNPPASLGPFVINAAGTTIDRIAVDFAFPGGLWAADGSGVAPNSIALRAQYQQIDDAGTPVGGWATLFAETIQAATRTPQRMSREVGVVAGRYQARFLADEAFDPDDGSAVNAVVWTGLRGYLTDFVTPPNCTLLAMKVRANDQLSQAAANQIRVTAERYLPIWNGDDWIEQKSRSIAWAAADLLMNTDYSIGLTAGQFDLATLTTLAATFANRGDNFDAIFDRSWTVQDALRAILRAGRTQAVRMGGRIGFVRLDPKLIRRAVFTPRNVVRGSFQHKLVLNDEEKPDSVLGTYLDASTWQEQEVLGSLASVGSDQPAKIEWFGITDHEHAWRESVTEAAVNAYCREFVSFTAEWEGKLLVRGEPILVQHPFIDMEAVQLAAIASRSGNTLTMDRALDHEIVGDAYAIIRAKDGKEWGPCLIDSFVGREITLDSADCLVVSNEMGSLDLILPDDRSERAHLLICDGASRPFNGLVVSATPNSAGKVDIVSVIDAPEVYLADATEVMPSPWTPPVLPPQNPSAPLVLGLYAALQRGIAQLELDAMWQPSPGATGGYVAEVSYDSDLIPDAQKSWTPVYSGSANRFTVPVLPQALVLRVAAIGLIRGAWTKRVFVPGEVPSIIVEIGDDAVAVRNLAEQLRNERGWVFGIGAGDSLGDHLTALEEQIAELAAAGLTDRVDNKLQVSILKARNAAATAAIIETRKAVAELNAAFGQFQIEVLAQLNQMLAGGLIKIEGRVDEAGAKAQILFKVRADIGDAFPEDAALVLGAEKLVGGASDSWVGIMADRMYFLATDGEVVTQPFAINANFVRINTLRFQHLSSIDGTTIVLNGETGNFVLGGG